MVETLETADVICIVIYFILVLVVGLWATCRPTQGSAAGYFLAGKNMHWFLVGSSIFASNVGAPKFIGFAGTAAASGFAVAIYEWHAIFLLILLGWIFVPVYIASGAFTMPEYLKKRFGGARLRVLLSVQSLIIYIMTKIAGEMYAGAIFMNQLLGINLYVSILLLLLVTAVYTVTGGMAAVLYTDTLQSIILLIAATILFFICMFDIGGWNNFMELYSRAASNLTLSQPGNHSCGMPRSDFDHIWRDPVTGDIPWTGAVFGLTTLGIWNWCTDQIMVQRCLSAKNMSHAKGGSILAAGLKITPFFLYLLPGMMSRIFFPEEVACADPDSCRAACGNPAGCSNIAYPLLVLRKMPTGLKGIMLSALLAAIMSTLTSVFNSASSMFTMDIWRRFRGKAKQSELMIVGRLCVVVLVGLSVVWVPIMEKTQGGQLWNYLQAISSCVSPPWCWVFLLALFWKGTTEQGAFWGLVITTGAGAVRMVMELSYSAPYCGSGEEDTRPDLLKKVNFLHFAIISSGISIISTVGISLLTKRRPEEKLRRVTWWTRHATSPSEETDSEDDLGLNEDEDEEDVEKKMTDEGEGAINETLPLPRKKTVARMAYNWMCGQQDSRRPKLSREEKELIKKKMTDIGESKTARRVTTVAAVVISLIGVFLLAFFG